MIYLILAGCVQQQESSFEVMPRALEVEAVNIQSVSIVKEGNIMVKQSYVEPVDYTKIMIDWPESGVYQIHLKQKGDLVKEHSIQVPVFPEITVLLEAPIGAQPIPLKEEMLVSVAQKSSVQIALHLIGKSEGLAVVDFGTEQKTAQVSEGSKKVVLHELQESQSVSVAFNEEKQSASIQIQRLNSRSLQEEIELVSEYFPASLQGNRDLSKSRDSVYMRGEVEQEIRRFLGVGRYTDPTIPHAFSSLAFRNNSKQDYSLVVQSRVLSSKGDVEPGFEPKSRQGEALNGWTRVLLRVKSESDASVSIPLYFNPKELKGDSFSREFEVFLLGQNEPIMHFSKEIRVTQSSHFALWGTVIGFLAALLGGIGIFIFGKSFSKYSVKQLVSTASFAAIIFTATATAYILSMSLSAALGPFSIMLTSVFDSLFRVTILITLLSIFPFIGTFSLCVIIGWLLSSTVFGGFSPVDILFLLGRIFWTEMFLWCLGITRQKDWLKESQLKKSIRFSIVLVSAGIIHTSAAFALQISLFRLYYADWYIWMVLLGPNGLYIAVACFLGVPFSSRVKGLIQ